MNQCFLFSVPPILGLVASFLCCAISAQTTSDYDQRMRGPINAVSMLEFLAVAAGSTADAKKPLPVGLTKAVKAKVDLLGKKAKEFNGAWDMLHPLKQ